MKTIAIDVMGNDNGVKSAVEATKIFLNKNKNYKIILVGNKKEIDKFFPNHERLEIIHTDKIVNKEIGIRESRKSDTSMAVAVNLVKNGQADAVISSGDSGTYLSNATLTLKRIKGFKRPSFLPFFPTIIKGKKFIFTDAGANIEVTSEMLYQWALIASIYYKEIFKENSPKVGIINIGTEENKGKTFHSEVNLMLKKDESINYVGFIEPRELLFGVVDVAIVDGYAGNMILKSTEGAISAIIKSLKDGFKSKLIYKLGFLLSKGVFKDLKDKLDHRNVGTALIIGLNGLAFKCHGSADTASYLGAFQQVKKSISSDIINVFNKEFNVKD